MSDDELPMPVDADGFLDTAAAVISSAVDARPGDLLTPVAAAEAHALVMLGEPGLGKTTALRAIADEIGGQAGKLSWFDGSDLDVETFGEEVGAVLQGLPPAANGASRPATAQPELTVVIDGLDESPMVRKLPRRLLTALAGRDTSTLRLLVGCRTADLPPSLREVLNAAFKPCLFVDLAPLRRREAVALAASCGVDGERLVDLAVRFGAGSLAAIPLTLQLLVRTFVQIGDLNQGARWLFDRGVTHLLAEENPESRPSTLEQRTAIAERIAAVLLLSGRRTVYLGPDLGIKLATDLRASGVSDGDETTPSGSFRVTLDLVRDTLASPLFSGRGEPRRAFGHSSHAAYLAARYLRRRDLPRRQLEGLFLVAGPDGSRTVPVPLRELAAWLASLDLDTGRWLAEADPQSLIGHDAYLESDELRSVVAASLLDKAEEFELGERAWMRSLRLSHAGLADQVRGVLDGYDVQPEAWPDFARCRLALRLAVHASSPELTTRLLEVVEGDGWNSHMRSMAAAAMLANDADASVPRLCEVLQRLRNRDYSLLADPDDELKGSLLDDLWPRHVPTDQIIPLLVARHTRNLIGSYWMFLRDFPARVRNDELESVLTWAAARVRDTPEPVVRSEQDEDDFDVGEAPLGSLDVTLVEALVDRALASGEFERLLDLAAGLVWPRFQRHDHPTLPTPLDDAGLEDPEPVTQKRRLFAEALIRFGSSCAAFDRADASEVIGYWRASHRKPLADGEEASPPRSRLLDVGDFGWALDRAVELDTAGNRAAALAMAEVAVLLFDRSDTAAVELASGQQGTVTWESLAVYFDAIPIEGETADRLRRWHEIEQGSNAEDDDVDDAEVLRDDLLTLYDRLSSGDVAEFWRLAWNLQFPPGTRHGSRRWDDRLLDFPGIAILGTDAPTRLARAAHEFVLSEHDHADDWLGTDRYDKRGWAGYLALALLDEFGELDALPPTCLASWVGAVLWFHSVPSETGDTDRKASLLSHIATAVPERLAHLLPLYVRGELRQGSTASEVGLVVPAPDPALHAAWLKLLHELTNALLAPSMTGTIKASRGRLRSLPDGNVRTNAMRTWETLLENLARADAAEAEKLVIGLLQREGGDRVRSLAATGVVVLLSAVPEAWPRLFPLVSGDPTLGRSVATAVTSGHRDVDLTAILDERELSRLYMWLASLFPPDEDHWPAGAHLVSPDELAGRVRDGVLTTIADRGTEASVRVLAELHDRFPLLPVVTSNLIRARIALFATAWVPPSPEAVQALLADARRRLVRSADELGTLIEETLDTIGEEMVRAGEFLWDRMPTARGKEQEWRPKPEAALASFIAHDLDLRLHGRGLAVHREVLIKATNPYAAGDRTDILVEANVAADALSHTTPERFRVVVEVKCPWNKDVLTDQRDQLAGRYLLEAQTGTGLFVVGWYPLELWASGDYRLRDLKAQTAGELEKVLLAQAAELRATGVSVKPLVLTVPRPAPNATRD